MSHDLNTHVSTVVDGQGLWHVSVPPLGGEPRPRRGVPLVDGKGHIVAALQHVLACLRHEPDGVSVVWEYVTGGSIAGSPAAAPDGSLRIHSSDGRLHGVSAVGERLWPPVEIGPPLDWASPLVDAAGVTWISAYAGGLLKVDADGRTLTRVDADGNTTLRPFFGSPVKFDCTGVLFGALFVVGGEDKFVHAIDTSGTRGTDIWEGDDQGRTERFINSGVALASGPTFVVASRDGDLHGFAPDGSRRWKSTVPGQALGSPVIDAEDRVFVGLTLVDRGTEPRGALACFDIRREQWLWEAAAPGPVECTPVVGDDGTVYFGDNSGCVQGVSAATGRVQWQASVGHPVRSAGIVAAPGRLVFADDAGRLFAIQCRSSTLSGGWPALLGKVHWQPPDLSTAAGVAPAQHILTRVQSPFDCSGRQPGNKKTVIEQPPAAVVAVPAAIEQSPARVESIPTAMEQPLTTVEPKVAVIDPPSTPSVVDPGRFAAVVDFLTGTDLLPSAPYAWSLPRQKVVEQRPLCLENDGPGDLVVSGRCFGKGASISPAGPIRIQPGRRRFVLISIQPHADEWLLVDFQPLGPATGRRVKLRIRRPGPP